MNYLLITLGIIFFTILRIIFLRPIYSDSIKVIALFGSLLSFLSTLPLLLFFNKLDLYPHLKLEMQIFSTYNVNLPFGIDGLSIFFVLLVTFLIPLCLLASWNSVFFLEKEYVLSFLILEFILILVFTIRDLLLFFFFFEASLIPMFILVGVWGSRERKVRASYLLFQYTFLGSVLLLLAIILLIKICGTTNLEVMRSFKIIFEYQVLLWIFFFFAFASKVPLFPFHLWLPEAHVEASTAGSVLLAGILLKLGIFGFLRFVLPLCPDACIFFSPFVQTLAIFGVIFASCTAMRQTDLKRIIAYTSVAHMNLVMIGVFSFKIESLDGVIFQSLCHGFVSSALFLLVGVLYERHHTRLVKYFSGLVHTMPLFTVFLLFFTMSNIALPGTGSFIGEFLILVGIFKANKAACFFGAIGMVLGGGYALWLLNRIVFGNLKIQFIAFFQDLNNKEFLVLFPLLIATILMGVCPNFFLNYFKGQTEFLMNFFITF